MAKDLKFKLVLDADVKDFVSNTKQSKEAVAAMFDEIRKQSQDAGQATQAASDGIDKVGTEAQESAKDVEKLASDLDSANKELKETDQSSDKAKVSLSNLKQAVGILGAALAAIGLGMTAKGLVDLSDATQQMNERLRKATDGTEEYVQVQSRMLELANATYRPLEEAQEVYLNTSGAMKALGYSTSEILDATDSLSLAFTHNATSSDLAQSAQDALTKSMVKQRVDADAWSTIMRATPNIAEDLAKKTGKATAEILKLGASGSISVRELTDTLIATRDANLDFANSMENSTADASQVASNNLRALVSVLNEQHNVSARLAQTIQDLSGDLSWLVPIFDDVMSAVDALSAEFDSIDPSVFEALKQAVSAAYDAVKQLSVGAYELSSDVLKLLIDTITNTFSVLSSFTGEAAEAGEQVGFLTRVGQGLSITFGAISDGVYAVRIALNLLVGSFYSVAAAANSAMAAVTWGDVSTQFSANADKMKLKSQEYYTEANKLAMNFESQTIKRLDQAIENEEQKNARILAENKKALDELLAIQEEDGENNEKLQARKLTAVQKFATEAIAANDGVLDAALELELAQKGFYVTVDEGGRIAVTRLTEQERATADATLAIKKQEVAFVQAAEAGKDFGLDVEKSLNKVSASFNDMQGKLVNFENQLKSAGVEGGQAGELIYKAWKKWADSAVNEAEIELAKSKLNELAEQGVVTGRQLADGLDIAKNKTRELAIEADETAEAFKRLGIQTKEQLALSAKQALIDMEAVRASGKATQADLQKAYQKTIDLAYASGDAAVIANANAKAASLGLSIQVDETGKTTVRSMEEAEAATQKVAKAAGYDATKGFKDMGDAAEEVAEKTKDSAEKAADSIGGFMARADAAFRKQTGSYKEQLIELGVEAGIAAQKAQQNYEQLWKEMFRISAAGKDANRAMQEHVELLEMANRRAKNQEESWSRWNAKVAETNATINDAMAAAAAFQSKISSIQDEYMKATGQESKMLEMRYRQRKQQLTLEYEMLKVQIATAKVAAESAKLDTKPLEKALADATAGYAEAQRQLIELEKMEKAKLEADKKLEDAKKTTDTAKPDATKPTPKPTDTLPKPPQINVNPPTVDLDVSQKTVRYEINLNGQTMEVFGDPSQESLINAFMDDLERYKRGM